MPALLGGFFITDVRWTGPQTIRVAFTSTYGAARYHQLYAGRTLVGVTSSPSERTVTGVVAPSTYPETLQLAAVLPGERIDDIGTDLPDRPYNRALLGFTATAWPADSKYLRVTAGTEPDGAVDDTNVLDNVLYDTNRAYTYKTVPMDGSGTWNFEVAGVDDAGDDGNVGTALALSADLLAHPPDVELNEDGTRLTVEVDSGTATISFAYPDW